MIYAQKHKLSSGWYVTMETQPVSLKVHNDQNVQISCVFNGLAFKIRNDINSLISIVIDYLLNGDWILSKFLSKNLSFLAQQECALWLISTDNLMLRSNPV